MAAKLLKADGLINAKNCPSSLPMLNANLAVLFAEIVMALGWESDKSEKLGIYLSDKIIDRWRNE